jgi:DNA-directed RNA polymerase specialized sigma24 family protein
LQYIFDHRGGKPINTLYSIDLELINTFLAGDRHVVKALHSALHTQISNCIRYMESRGARFQDKDDVVSDLVFQILLKDDHKILRAFSGQSKLTTYLWPIIRNRLIDYMRHEKRYTSRHLPVSQDFPCQTHDEEMTAGIITEHIARESAQERFIKQARWLLDMSYEEIISLAGHEFPDDPPLPFARIAYVLHANRKKLAEKLKIYISTDDK